MDREGVTALVLGGSGSIGQELVKELIRNPSFTKVTVITRRKLDNIEHEKIDQRIVDFEKLTEYAEAFTGSKVGFCCLGTTRNKAGAQGFVKVDRDYIHEAAKLLKNSSCQHFHLVTSKGSNKASNFLYLKTKGEVESLVTDLGFSRLSIYRPSLLICDRDESRPMEKVAQLFAKGFDWRSRMSIPVETVAHAMVTNTFLQPKEAVEILEHNDINKLGID